jgi:hypothetical protein
MPAEVRNRDALKESSHILAYFNVLQLQGNYNYGKSPATHREMLMCKITTYK